MASIITYSQDDIEEQKFVSQSQAVSIITYSQDDIEEQKFVSQVASIIT